MAPCLACTGDAVESSGHTVEAMAHAIRRGLRAGPVLALGCIGAAVAEVRIPVHPGETVLPLQATRSAAVMLSFESGQLYRLNLHSTGGEYVTKTAAGQGLPVELNVACGPNPLAVHLIITRLVKDAPEEPDRTGDLVLTAATTPIPCPECRADWSPNNCLSGEWRMAPEAMPQYFPAISTMCGGVANLHAGRTRLAFAPSGHFTVFYEAVRATKKDPENPRKHAVTRYSGQATACYGISRSVFDLAQLVLPGRDLSATLKLSSFTDDTTIDLQEQCYSQDRSRSMPGAAQAHLVHVRRPNAFECRDDELLIRNVPYRRLTQDEVPFHDLQQQIVATGRVLIEGDGLGRGSRSPFDKRTAADLHRRAEIMARATAQRSLEARIARARERTAARHPGAAIDWRVDEPRVTRSSGDWNDRELEHEEVEGSPVPVIVETYEVRVRISAWVEYRAIQLSDGGAALPATGSP